MTQPLAFGRKLPHNDWEGDDRTPGAGGAFVTCTDTAAGRAVAWATNGRTDLDGRTIRAMVYSNAVGGLTLPQAAGAVHRLTGLPLVVPAAWVWAQCLAWLARGNGLVVTGHYAALPRAYRYQAFADFDHAMWASHYSPSSGVRVWDPLNPDTTGFGRWVPLPVFKAFTLSRGYIAVGYVPLQPL
jgi:hypothetical protein